MSISITAVFEATTGFIGGHRGAMLTLGLLPFAASFLHPLAAAAVADDGPVAAGVVALAVSLLSLLGQLAVAAYTLAPDAGAGRAIGRAGRRLPLAIAIYLAVLLALIAAAAPLLAVPGFADLAAGGDVAIGGGALAVLAGWGGLVTVGVVIVSARLATLGPVIVAERRGIGAIGRAVRVTRGLTGRLVGLLLLLAVIALVATLAVQTVVGSLARLLLDGDGAGSPAALVTASVVALVVAGLTVLAATFDAMLYRTLVAPAGATAAA